MTVRKIRANLIIYSLIISAGINPASSFETKPTRLFKNQDLSLPSEIKSVKIKRRQVININQLKYLIKENNQELVIMNSKIEQKKYILKSKLSAWYPNLNLSSNGLPQYLDGSIENELSSNSSSRQWKSSLNATIQWDIINPSRIPDINEAKDQLENAKLAYLIQYRSTYLEALSNFFMLQKSNEYVRIAKDSIKTSETSLKEAEIRLESGIGTKFEVLEAKSQLAKDNQFLIKKIGEKKINQRKLAKILNLKETTNPVVISKARRIGSWETSLEQSIISAYSYREEFDQLRMEVSINNNQAKSTLASSKPTISLYNTYSTSWAQGESNVINPNDENNIYSRNNTVGIRFDWKIFNGGYAKANYNSKKEKNKELMANLELKRSEIRKEIEESYFNLEIAEKNISNTMQEVESAKESLRLALIRLKAGITTQREVVSNQRDLTQAEVNYIEAITDYNLNLVNLRQQTGIGTINQCIIKKENKKKTESIQPAIEKCLTDL